MRTQAMSRHSDPLRRPSARRHELSTKVQSSGQLRIRLPLLAERSRSQSCSGSVNENNGGRPRGSKRQVRALVGIFDKRRTMTMREANRLMDPASSLTNNSASSRRPEGTIGPLERLTNSREEGRRTSRGIRCEMIPLGRRSRQR